MNDLKNTDSASQPPGLPSIDQNPKDYMTALDLSVIKEAPDSDRAEVFPWQDAPGPAAGSEDQIASTEADADRVWREY